MLKQLPIQTDANVLVGFDTSDDAGVYRLDAERALVTTADFITPPVDDPYLYGQIAAANALSDIYAMGGTPLACLSLVGFPGNKLGGDVLLELIRGAMSKIAEAGAVLVGGHTTDDEEPKFGLSVTGMVHPDRIWRNSGARPGDRLILTKPVGSGVLFNANLKGWVSAEALGECLGVLTTLNRMAAEVFMRHDVHGATDITGFGLAGHAMEMARASNATLAIHVADVPFMREAVEVYRRGMTTGMNLANRRLVEKDTRFSETLSRWDCEMMIDPQTSGGLLASVAGDAADGILAELYQSGVTDARIVGEVRLKEAALLVFD